MTIAIVENESFHIKHLKSLLSQWESEHSIQLEILVFESGDEILSSQFHQIDLIFMDIQMDGLNGVNTSQSLRSLRYEGEIVFLTSYTEYVFQGYDVRAFNYFVKPVDYEKISKCLNFLVEKFKGGFHVFGNQTTIFQIPYSKILFLSSANHYTEIITADNVYRQLEPMKKVFATLPSCFQYCHRTIVVNIEHIITIEGKTIILTNHSSVPISNTYLKSIKTSILKFTENYL